MIMLALLAVNDLKRILLSLGRRAAGLSSRTALSLHFLSGASGGLYLRIPVKPARRKLVKQEYRNNDNQRNKNLRV